jgi:hypothetical protein
MTTVIFSYENNKGKQKRCIKGMHYHMHATLHCRLFDPTVLPVIVYLIIFSTFVLIKFFKEGIIKINFFTFAFDHLSGRMKVSTT